MKRLLITAVSGLCLCASLALSHPVNMNDPAARIVTLQLTDYHKQLQTLASMGFDIAGVDIESKSVDIVANKEEATFLSIYYGATPVNIKQIKRKAPDARYTNPDELATFVQKAAADYPNIVRLTSFGKSVEGRDLWAVKITDNPDQRELDEPAVLFNSMHHAREIMTVEVAMDTIEQLTSGYGNDSDITNWVDSTEIWVVPMLNPDGNNKVWTGQNMWRKNTGGYNGIDLNRNYPYDWGKCNGSSTRPRDDDYRGPSPASEPETRAMMKLVADTEPVFNISYHSYSELVIYPYGCEGDYTATRDVVEGVAENLARKIPKDYGSGSYTPGTGWELLYETDGGDIDWMYNEYNVIPYVIEINSMWTGFQPGYSMRQSTVSKLRNAWKFVLERVHQSGVRGIVTDRTGQVQPDAMINITSLNPGSFDPVTWRVKYDGTYHLVLNPGMYKLRFSVGGQDIEHDVTIGDMLTTLDIQL